jgi:biofilm PGA synthesis N-glycosyltransferase PgaC
LAIFIIYGIAIVPGFMNAFIIASIILDKRPKRLPLKKQKYPPITIIIAAYNEGNNIKDTIESMAEQKYPGGKRVIVANDGSTDNTVA